PAGHGPPPPALRGGPPLGGCPREPRCPGAAGPRSRRRMDRAADRDRSGQPAGVALLGWPGRPGRGPFASSSLRGERSLLVSDPSRRLRRLPERLHRCGKPLGVPRPPLHHASLTAVSGRAGHLITLTHALT